MQLHQKIKALHSSLVEAPSTEMSYEGLYNLAETSLPKFKAARTLHASPQAMGAFQHIQTWEHAQTGNTVSTTEVAQHSNGHANLTEGCGPEQSVSSCETTIIEAVCREAC